MAFALRLIVAGFSLLFLCRAEAQEKAFSHAAVQADAKRYEAGLKANAAQANRQASQPRADGERLLAAGDPRAASRSYIGAVLADANDAAAWLGLAKALLAIAADRGSERYELPVNASGAAWNAYARATAPAAKAAALAVLAEALKRRSYWRPALDALAASLSLVEEPTLREAYEQLLAEHGFRILEYKVDADAAQPRVCVEFSERLVPGRTDWATFLKVDGKDPQTVTAEARQLCLDGLAHGKRYEVQVRTGLPSALGESLRKTAELAIYVKDRAPSVRATGRGYVLPNRGQQGIPLVSVNTASVKVEVYRIGDRSLAQTLQGGDFGKQLSAFEIETLKERTGSRVYAGELAVSSRLNEDVTSAFPIAEAVPKLQPGVYVLVANATGSKGDERSGAVQWFIISDLGLTSFSGEDGLHVFVRSLATTTPVVNANLRLLARNNEVLGTSKTDSRGYARFEAGLQRGEGGLAPAALVAEVADGDYAFLDLAAAAFDLTDRGVKGRVAPAAIDAFAYTDRGVYRPGETVYLTALARNRLGNAVSLPLTFIVSRPDGVEYKRLTLADQGLGARSSELSLAASAMTGTWRVRVHSEPKAGAIAQAAFLVEDFVPERLELKLEPAVTVLSPDQPGSVNLIGRYLYGPPAAGLAVEGEVVVKPSNREVANFAGFKFGLADEQISPVRKPLDQLPVTDAQGRAAIGLGLPALPHTSRQLEADVIVKLRESGGRTIERTITLPIDLKARRIGIKPLFSGGQIGEGELARFEVVVLDADGQPLAAKPVKWELLRLDQRWQWYSRDGAWNYEPIVNARRVAAGSSETSEGAPGKIEARVDWGRYRLEVVSPDGSISSLIFNSGYWADEAADSPEILDVALDKPAYRIGETARLRIVSRLAGRAMIAVLNSGLASAQDVDVPAGGADVPLHVGEDWGPGAYVTVMLYRPMQENAKRMPSRALGLRWLAVDQTPRLLNIGFDVPPQIKSGAKLSVPVRIGGLKPAEEAFVTLAAVDLGILNLTRFEPPKPEAWFFGQRRLGTDIRDLYGRLIDGMRAERGTLRSGGDGGSDGMSLAGSPPVEATLALFSGIVRLDANGAAKIDFQLPDFNGTVRLSAVAWSSNKLGSASKDVIVRDPVAITASAPRFLTLGDRARLEIAVHNVDGVAGSYAIAARQEADAALGNPPALEFTRSISLAAGERKRESFELKATEVGRMQLALSLTGPNGIEVRRRLAFDVKVPAGDIKRLTVASLAANGGKITLSSALLQDLIPARSKISVAVGPTAGFDVPGLLASLDRYPYGCAEQTTSRALPLIYVNEVSKRIGLASDSQIRERVEAAIARVFELQDSTGAFGIWGPSDGDMWLTSYVTDFLTRAREAGYTVPQQPFGRALDRLQNFISYAQDFEKGGEGRAYALYVLARNSRAPIGELRYYVDTKLDAFATPLAQAQLGAALAMLGDKSRAERALEAALKRIGASEDGSSRRDYGSGMRDGAALLTLVAESGVAKPAVPRLVDVLAKAYANRTYTSTQEQAWMLLAAHALSEDAKSITLAVGARPHQGTLLRGLTAAELAGDGVVISNRGEASVDAVVSVVGAALTPEPAVAKGFSIERTYYDLDGRKIDLASATGGTGELKQNDRLVVVIKVEAAQKGGRILLVDRLPAGLEIENPRLLEAGDVKTLAWLKTTLKPNHTDFRDDRFVAAFDFFGSSGRRGTQYDGDDDGEPASSATVAYLVRAVTPGSFVHPAATVEDMYRPERFARTASGQLVVTARE